VLPAVGVYDLVVAGQAPWHRHALTVRAVDERSVEGVVALDRAPLSGRPRDVDELPVAAPFLAARSADASFAFALTIGAGLPSSLAFALQAVDGETIGGTLAVATVGSAVTRRAAVVARRR
jgi:hypothetical protein